MPTVEPDNRGGARRLACALVELGHRRFAVLCGPAGLLTARDRLEGFRQGLAEAGGVAADVVEGGFTRDGGHAVALELLGRGTASTCVFAVNDVMAVGAMAALRERGVPVPQAMSVAGFDDIATLRDTVPALTTVRLPLEEMGEQAARLTLLRARRCGRSRHPARSSCARAPGLRPDLRRRSAVRETGTSYGPGVGRRPRRVGGLSPAEPRSGARAPGASPGRPTSARTGPAGR